MNLASDQLPKICRKASLLVVVVGNVLRLQPWNQIAQAIEMIHLRAVSYLPSFLVVNLSEIRDFRVREIIRPANES